MSVNGENAYVYPGDPKFATKAIHVGQDPDQWKSRAVVPLISMSSTFKQSSPGVLDGGYEYSRGGNPTRDVLEKCIAALENGKKAMTFSSGLAALTAVTNLLEAGDHLICMDDVYGGTNRFFRNVAMKHGIAISFIDCTNLDNITGAIRENTKMVLIETPTNPLMKIVDIQRVSKIVKEKSKAFLVVDNTFMSPYFQNPLDLGADVVLHSITKYMNGHSDVVMGCLVSNTDDLISRLIFQQYAAGSVPSPFDCYLVNRGLKTLHLRMREHMVNGLAVANFLSKHPNVEKVIYPGLASHPQHELAKRQCHGFSGMVSFYVKGELESAKKFAESVKVFTLAESLGGYDSLVDHPAIMTHASIKKEERNALGITDNLVRLSVGLESIQDLLDDLDQALQKCQ
ncbi:Cystathionine gamma-lyase [Nymphon striatum]|nr:Cystathionine gamma-lyase [Nymphon striatum]